MSTFSALAEDDARLARLFTILGIGGLIAAVVAGVLGIAVVLTAADSMDRSLAVTADAVTSADETVALAADTIGTIDVARLGKPSSPSEDRAHLRRLSGRSQLVLTGVAVILDELVATGVETTRVTFTELSESDIEWYVATGEPDDKAGSYALQGAGGVFVTGIEGSFDNVIGLPRNLLSNLVAELGHDLLRLATGPAEDTHVG